VELTIGTPRKQDFEKARKFAVEGMHLTWFTRNKIELFFYSKYFIYLEKSRATRAYGAYVDNRFVGLLLLNIQKEEKLFSSIWEKAYIGLFSFIENRLYRETSRAYEDANRQLFYKYREYQHPDGELNFFVVDPGFNGRGIGSFLLSRMQLELRGKRIFVFTDSASTYQFYLKRGFSEEGEMDINIDITGKKNINLTCYLFEKSLTAK
jgi:GNAT superfamily N-acetyltransferase